MFHLYILRMADGRFYVGITDDLARRGKQHEKGDLATRTTRVFGAGPILYQEEFRDLKSALARERQLKKWSHAKKTTLIQGDLPVLKLLAKRNDRRPRMPIRKIIFDRPAIQAAVQRIASGVVAWRGDLPDLDLVCVLEGARPFTRDLVKHLGDLKSALVVRVHEVGAHGTDGTRLLEERVLSIGELAAGIQGRDLLLVDDLADSGKTLAALKAALRKAGAREVRTAVLVRKYGEESGPVDLCGFDLKLDRRAMAQQGIQDHWLFGYGMDEDGKSRDLDHIGWLEVR